MTDAEKRFRALSDRRKRSEGEEDRAQQHDPGELDRSLELWRIVDEARRDDRNDPRGRDVDDHGEGDESDEHQVRDRRDHPPRPGLVAGRKQGGRNRDDRGRQRPGRDELEHQIGQPEGGEECVEIAAGPEELDHDHIEPASTRTRTPRNEESAFASPWRSPDNRNSAADRGAARDGRRDRRPAAGRQQRRVDLGRRQALARNRTTRSAHRLADASRTSAGVRRDASSRPARRRSRSSR